MTRYGGSKNPLGDPTDAGSDNDTLTDHENRLLRTIQWWERVAAITTLIGLVWLIATH